MWGLVIFTCCVIQRVDEVVTTGVAAGDYIFPGKSRTLADRLGVGYASGSGVCNRILIAVLDIFVIRAAQIGCISVNPFPVVLPALVEAFMPIEIILALQGEGPSSFFESLDVYYVR